MFRLGRNFSGWVDFMIAEGRIGFGSVGIGTVRLVAEFTGKPTIGNAARADMFSCMAAGGKERLQ